MLQHVKRPHIYIFAGFAVHFGEDDICSTEKFTLLKSQVNKKNCLIQISTNSVKTAFMVKCSWRSWIGSYSIRAIILK